MVEAPATSVTSHRRPLGTRKPGQWKCLEFLAMGARVEGACRAALRMMGEDHISNQPREHQPPSTLHSQHTLPVHGRENVLSFDLLSSKF